MIDCDELKILLKKLFFKNIPEYALTECLIVKNNSDINYTLESDCAPQHTSHDMDFLNELTKNGIIKSISIVEYPRNFVYGFSGGSLIKVNGFRINITIPIKNTDMLKFLLKISV